MDSPPRRSRRTHGPGALVEEFGVTDWPSASRRITRRALSPLTIVKDAVFIVRIRRDPPEGASGGIVAAIGRSHSIPMGSFRCRLIHVFAAGTTAWRAFFLNPFPLVCSTPPVGFPYWYQCREECCPSP